jgi:hypothetical protein
MFLGAECLTQPRMTVTFAEATLRRDEENSLKHALELARLMRQVQPRE